MKKNISIFLWVAAIIFIGFIIGSVVKPEISIWYSQLNRSTLTPPNYVFPIVWTFLYALIGIAGWHIWNNYSSTQLIKNLFLSQLLLNWLWTPLFFYYHFVAYALFVLIILDVVVAIIIYISFRKMRLLSLLMLPYQFWILFATYLNLYIMLTN